ncbi:hypothetical protein [Nannocystis pusilla]|uniref:Uncharacterized protein n=1 Tax=Nannocystis pusilla TaxID=889268 RepID=A0ABS7TMF8_9BACT|nr:hypothetical protein [Nannocystis pusilla]MBZ5709403.1 hypothetical protein [Nannocystis pusilla]
MHVEWNKGDHAIHIDGRSHLLPGRVDQVMEWPDRPLIAILLEDSAGPQRLLVLDEHGQTRARLGSPAGFDLYYLTPNSRYGITAVCTTEPPVDGWRDWQFAISLERGELVRVSPSR